MVASSILALVLAASASTSWAGPLNKRIAQTIADSTAKWEQACTAAGGADKCNPLSQTAFMTLLAAAGPCDQQNAGDQMIDLAKQLNNNADMIKFTQIFVQQPRNSPDSFSIPYCQQAPKNSELNGLFQCQFDGTKDTFTGNLQAGAQGTVPLGLQSLNPPKSCPANPQGGIADGTQLVDVTQDPGLNNIKGGSGNSGNNSGNTGSGSGNSTGSDSGNSTGSDSGNSTGSDSGNSTGSDSGNSTGGDSGNDTGSGSDSGSTGSSNGNTGDTGDSSSDNGSSCNPISSAAAPSATATGNNAAATPSSSSSSFVLQNGKDAQKLNAEFKNLSADSSCNTGDSGCVGSSFALCSNGKFDLMDCSTGGNTCAALPLVNKPGTSVTCVSESEALQRIAATGATGGLTGSD
ncbi:uncharacterized protein FOMMEDRAFT_167061 [Fomitiporia mediterranea MF3/22]|uniref:uncharacterized protein n=1 Tax=Fomitiporia mediterranea (strain MF3/22) TaxID=694068 RepID=UPI0004409634|nr:uncharacterized protein FOMMEDRAFT_167061 [Fomitiporia mediterranea MF3/22]EJD03734.1 hypothetical protein FOMMEDRAFT_167061 [Fomitiporia mediterranea MF3/22]